MSRTVPRSLAVALITSLALIADATASQFETRFEISVRIDEVIAQVGFDDFDGSDFYAIVTIDGTTVSNLGTTGQVALEDMDAITPALLNVGASDWTFEKTIQHAGGTIPIVVRILEEDDNPDDIVDLENGPGVNLDFNLDPNACQLSGELAGPCGSFQSMGDGDGDGNAIITLTVDASVNNTSAGAHVHCVHDPIWPQPGDAVTITATALGDDLHPKTVDTIRVFVDSRAAVASVLDTHQTSVTTLPLQGDFFYGCQVLDGSDDSFTGFRLVKVGPVPDDDAVPVVMLEDVDDRVDLVLIPDADSHPGGGADPAFRVDALNLLKYYYASGIVFLDKQHLLNVWISQTTGKAAGSSGNVCTKFLPSSWSMDFPFYDAALILHRKDIRDCSSGDFASVQMVRFDDMNMQIPFELELGFTPAVHELGHALFGLKDEYCCDGGYAQLATLPNVFDNLLDCDDDRLNEDPDGAMKTCQSWISVDPATSGDIFWTYDPAMDDLMVDNRTPRFLDIRRIEARFKRCLMMNAPPC